MCLMNIEITKSVTCSRRTEGEGIGLVDFAEIGKDIPKTGINVVGVFVMA